MSMTSARKTFRIAGRIRNQKQRLHRSRKKNRSYMIFGQLKSDLNIVSDVVEYVEVMKYIVHGSKNQNDGKFTYFGAEF